MQAEPAETGGLDERTAEAEWLANFAPSPTVKTTPRVGAKERGETTIAEAPFVSEEAKWRLPASLIDVREADLVDGAYRQTLPDGTLITFNVMDLFEFRPGTDKVGALTLIYDTHPIRQTTGNKYES